MGEQPGHDAAATRVVSPGVPPGFYQRLLRHLLGECRHPDDGQRQTEDPRLVAAHERRGRIGVIDSHAGQGGDSSLSGATQVVRAGRPLGFIGMPWISVRRDARTTWEGPSRPGGSDAPTRQVRRRDRDDCFRAHRMAGLGLDETSGASSGGEQVTIITSPSDGDTVDSPFMLEWDSTVPLGPPDSGKDHVHVYVDGKTNDYTVVGANEFEVEGSVSRRAHGRDLAAARRPLTGGSEVPDLRHGRRRGLREPQQRRRWWWQRRPRSSATPGRPAGSTRSST